MVLGVKSTANLMHMGMTIPMYIRANFVIVVPTLKQRLKKISMSQRI
ncbi:MAG: hypothetical protein RL152_48 [Bacteroidota bacterium]